MTDTKNKAKHSSDTTAQAKTNYNHTLYCYGYGGVITAYIVTTGEILWIYAASSISTESAYGSYYPIGVPIIADRKLYTVTDENSAT